MTRKPGSTDADIVPIRSDDAASVIAGYGIAIARALEYSGVDSRRVFHAAGVDAALSNDPLQRLPVSSVTRLYKAAVEVTGDPYFGLTVAKFIHASNLHALGYGLLASASLADFCLRLQRYMHLVSRSSSVERQQTGFELRLRHRPAVAVCAETEDAWLASLIRIVRLVYKPDFHPLRVEFIHARPGIDDDRYVTYFGAPVSFGNTESTLVFSSGDLDVPWQGSCPELAQFNDNLAATYLAKLDRSDTVACVRAKIVEMLPSGDCSKTRVAAALCMSPANLQLKLKQQDTNFHQLMDEIRKDFACAYLRQPSLSITEITYMLGFTDISNFTRAFKRWTGSAPTAFRSGALP